jgi:hypothetical protein
MIFLGPHYLTAEQIYHTDGSGKKASRTIDTVCGSSKPRQRRLIAKRKWKATTPGTTPPPPNEYLVKSNEPNPMLGKL